jgi:hypothetical protein
MRFNENRIKELQELGKKQDLYERLARAIGKYNLTSNRYALTPIFGRLDLFHN